MNNDIELIKKIYKPYKITIKNNIRILETTSGKYVLKNRKKNINKLFAYLKSRQFINYVNIVEDNRVDVALYEYIDDIYTPNEQKILDIVDVAANLHYKTTYYKKISEDKYKELYENILSNIESLNKYYIEIFIEIDKQIYMSPSSYLLIRNSSKILSLLEFCKTQANEWYDMVKENDKQRVCIVHNNLKIEHLLKNENDYLISWDHFTVDTPVIDLVTLYKNEFFNVDFETALNRYLKKSPFSDSELKLFLILVSIIDRVTLTTDELISCKNVRLLLDYIYITEKLIRPYYSTDKKE